MLSAANEARRPTEIKWAINSAHQFLHAYVKKYKDPDTGRIRSEVVVTTENYCLARFLAAKELMHCFIDDDGLSATNSIELVYDLIDDLIAGNGLTRTAPQTIVDEIAWIGASLYLIPDQWVPALEASYAAIHAQFPQVNAHLHLAQLIRVPEVILKTRLKHANWSWQKK
ncbi:hypothetical protein CAL14_05445 [Bordetella genomosp. 9]|nr:hypothetical protein CAL14_05445 [Bordetella genomosp. 9]